MVYKALKGLDSKRKYKLSIVKVLKMQTPEQIEKLTKSIDIELVNSEDLRADIRDGWDLPATGLVIKKTTRNSPGMPDYTFIGVDGTAFIKNIEALASKINVAKLCEDLRKELIK
ncbi:MAG: hypothetical protein WA139_03235 [Candidatus Aenigmatarchaeota archaeon]